MKISDITGWLLFFFLLLTNPICYSSSTVIPLSTYEIPPYVGKNLPNQGATSEIVRQAFRASGILTENHFFPAARAFTTAAQGITTATFPITLDSKYDSSLLLSNPFPGIQLGLLRKISTGSQSHNVAGKTVGVLRGTFENTVKQQLKGAKIQEANSNEMLLKMLFAGRIDYVFIDKFTAADLMVGQFPHMIGKMEFIKESATSIDFRLGVNESSADSHRILAAFNEGLKKISLNGSLNKILYKHGLLSFKQTRKKTLRIATVANGEMITMKRLSSQFEKENPDIELEWRVLDETILRRRLLSDLAVSNGQYDIMTIGSYETPIWAKDGHIIPITQTPEEYDLNDLIESVRTSLSYKDQLFALPFYAESSMTYYRTDLFAEAGISMPSNPTWQQIASYADKIHDPDNKIYGICLRGKVGWGENTAIVSNMVNSHGGQWFDMNWKSKLNSAEWKNALTLYLNLAKQYGPPGKENLGYAETLALFSQGHCGIWVDATVAAGTLLNSKTSKVSDAVGFAPTPTASSVDVSPWLWTWALAVPSSSQNKTLAFKFIHWATSKTFIEMVAKDLGWKSVPPGTRHSTYSNNQYRTSAPFAEFVFNSINASSQRNTKLSPIPYNSVQYVPIPEFPSLGTYVGLKIHQALLGEITVDRALKDAHAFVEKKMHESGYN
jgi:multiple sugar transport system substrate-binding protein